MLTKREMSTKVCSKCREVKLFSEFNKKKASKDGYRSECKACAKEYNAEYYAANPEKKKEYRAANTEKRKEYDAKRYADNPEKKKEYQVEYYAANPEKCRESQAEYQKANPEKGRAKNSNRRAAKLEAIPSWLTKADYQVMDAIHKEAKRLEAETGIKHHVDHIHPLQGKLVCGFHCPANLQILTEAENCSKGNRFTPYVESA